MKTKAEIAAFEAKRKLATEMGEKVVQQQEARSEEKCVTCGHDWANTRQADGVVLGLDGWTRCLCHHHEWQRAMQ